jgi:hypothetical protein
MHVLDLFGEESQPLNEGAVKNRDIERQDYENMSGREFLAAYKMGKAEWASKNPDIAPKKSKPKTTNEAKPVAHSIDHAVWSKKSPDEQKFLKQLHPDLKIKNVPQATRPERVKKTPIDYAAIARKAENVWGNIFPDGDPGDWMYPYLKRMGIPAEKQHKVLNRAIKLHVDKKGYDHWLESSWDQVADDNGMPGVVTRENNPWRVSEGVTENSGDTRAKLAKIIAREMKTAKSSELTKTQRKHAFAVLTRAKEAKRMLDAGADESAAWAHFQGTKQEMAEGKWFRTTYGWAGGEKPGGGKYVHPEVAAERRREKAKKKRELERQAKSGTGAKPTTSTHCPGCYSTDIKTYSDGEKECHQCHKTWHVKGVAEGLDILKAGSSVMVPHKGKMVSGKVVRYEPGKGGYSPAYVVDIGEYESKIVPVHAIKQGVAEGFNDTDTVFLTPAAGHPLSHLRYKTFKDASPLEHKQAIQYHLKGADRATPRKAAFHDMRAKMHRDWISGKQGVAEGGQLRSNTSLMRGVTLTVKQHFNKTPNVVDQAYFDKLYTDTNGTNFEVDTKFGVRKVGSMWEVIGNKSIKNDFFYQAYKNNREAQTIAKELNYLVKINNGQPLVQRKPLSPSAQARKDQSAFNADDRGDVYESDKMESANTGEPKSRDELYHYHLEAARISQGKAKEHHLQQAEKYKPKKDMAENKDDVTTANVIRQWERMHRPDAEQQAAKDAWVAKAARALTAQYFIVNSDTNKTIDGPFDTREEAEAVYDRMIKRVEHGTMEKNFKIQKKQGVAEGYMEADDRHAIRVHATVEKLKKLGHKVIGTVTRGSSDHRISGDEPLHTEISYKDKKTNQNKSIIVGWKGPKQGVAEGYWKDAIQDVEAARKARKGKPFEKNPLSHDERGVYIGDKDLAGNPVPKPNEKDMAETKVSKYADMGANEYTTHFLKNITTGKIVSPHRGKADAEDALVAANRGDKVGHKFKIVRARKQGVAEAKQGLYANVQAKRRRIKQGSGERMRKPGTKGAPTAQAWRDAAKTAKKESVEENMKSVKEAALPEELFKTKSEINNPTDSVKMDIPLLIRIMEYAREDAKTDLELHDVAERLISLGKAGNTLSMRDYDKIVGTDAKAMINNKL